jgi:hypothetical protein
MSSPPPSMNAAVTWAHSFVEYEGYILVYRLRDRFPFPPSRRGRETLSLDPSGRATAGAPGPDDRVMAQAARPFDILEKGPEILKLRMR